MTGGLEVSGLVVCSALALRLKDGYNTGSLGFPLETVTLRDF